MNTPNSLEEIQTEPQTPDSAVKVELNERDVYLVGTAHVSQQSVEAVRRAITELEPDCVCVELDEQRLETLMDNEKWRNLDLVSALRKGKGGYLLASLVLSSFQRRIGMNTGVKPGAELAEAVAAARENNINVELVDRPIRSTLLRMWRGTGLFKKLMLVSTLIASAFESPEFGEEDLAKLKEKDTLSALLDELGDELPSARRILIDERDRYMAAKINQSSGKKIVAVVGAGHVPGIVKCLKLSISKEEVSALDEIPAKSTASKVVPWVVPVIVAALFAVGIFHSDTAKLTEAAWAWVIANGALSALGALLALGHPAAILSAAVAAPLTSLNPAIGAGMVTGVVQAWVNKPRVSDLENLTDDLANTKGWWTNRVSRVLLVFFFSNLGSSIGTFVAFKWLKELI